MDKINKYKITQDYENLLDYQKSMLFTITNVCINYNYIKEQNIGIKGGFIDISNLAYVDGNSYALQYKDYAFFNAIVKYCKSKSKPTKVNNIILEHCISPGPELLRLLKNASFYNVLKISFNMYESDIEYIKLIFEGIREKFPKLFKLLKNSNTKEIMSKTKYLSDEEFDELYDFFNFVIS